MRYVNSTRVVLVNGFMYIYAFVWLDWEGRASLASIWRTEEPKADSPQSKWVYQTYIDHQSSSKNFTYVCDNLYSFPSY